MGSEIHYYEGAASAPMHGKAATGIGKAIYVGDFQTLMITLSSSGTTTATVKFAMSLNSTLPDFTASASPTNQWGYVQVKNRDTDAGINGATGIAFAGTDAVYMLELNTDAAAYFCPIVTAYSAGSINVDVMAINHYT